MNYFTEDEKKRIRELKKLTVLQVAEYGDFPKHIVYILIKHAKEIEFPLLPRLYHKKQYFIDAEKFINWMDKIYSGEIRICHLFQEGE